MAPASTSQLGNANTLYGLASSVTGIGGPARWAQGSRRAGRAGHRGRRRQRDVRRQRAGAQPAALPLPGWVVAGEAGLGGRCCVTWPTAGPTSGPGPGWGSSRSSSPSSTWSPGRRDGARTGRGSRVPRRSGGVGDDHGRAGRGRDRRRAGAARPQAEAPDGGRDDRHVLLRAAGYPDGPARIRAAGGVCRLACGAGAAVSNSMYTTSLQQQIPADRLAWVSCSRWSPRSASA